MLEVTGTLNGRVLEEAIISADELIEAFNLDFPYDSPAVTFKINKDNHNVVTTNRADNRPRSANKWNLTPFISGFYNGANVQIRYYQSKIPQGLGKKARYTPNRVEFAGKSRSVNLATKKEEAVFMMLFPLCGQSPLRDPRRHGIVYNVADPGKAAQVEFSKESANYELQGKIFALTDEMASMIALGYKAGGRSIPQDTAINPVSARVALLNLAKADPKSVYEALASQPTLIAGTVVHAAANHLIELKNTHTGKRAWHYSTALGGDMITEVPAKGNPKDHLAKYLLNRQAWINFQQVTAIAKPGSLETQIEEQRKSSDSEEETLAREAIESRIVALHPTEDKIYILEPGGHFQDRALLVIKGSRDNWREELISRTNKIITGRLKARMESAVNAI